MSLKKNDKRENCTIIFCLPLQKLQYIHLELYILRTVLICLILVISSEKISIFLYNSPHFITSKLRQEVQLDTLLGKPSCACFHLLLLPKWKGIVKLGEAGRKLLRAIALGNYSWWSGRCFPSVHWMAIVNCSWDAWAQCVGERWRVGGISWAPLNILQLGQWPCWHFPSYSMTWRARLVSSWSSMRGCSTKDPGVAAADQRLHFSTREKVWFLTADVLPMRWVTAS